MTRQEQYEEWLAAGAPGMRPGESRDWRPGMSSEGGRDMMEPRIDPVPEAVEALVDHARDLRIRAHELRLDPDAAVKMRDPGGRIVGYEVAAALNEVAAALLRCA